MPKDPNAADAAPEVMPEAQAAPAAPAVAPAPVAQAAAPAVMDRDATIAALVEQQRRQRLIDEAQAEADRQRAEEDAAAIAAALPEGWVWCRVLPLGDDKIYTGEQDRLTFPRYAKGDRFKAERSTAMAHEKTGKVEILP